MVLGLGNTISSQVECTTYHLDNGVLTAIFVRLYTAAYLMV